MELRKLTSVGTYEQINSGAHRKAAQIVGVPSLVRHLGLWSVVAGDREAAFRTYVERLRTAIESPENVALCRDFLTTVSGLDERIDTGTVTLVRFWWHGVRANIRLEFHTEYITLTSILDLSVKSPAEMGAARDPALADLWSALDEFRELFETCRPPVDRCYGKVSDALQIHVWERFEEEVLNLSTDGGTILGDMLGEVFLDSRGIVTGSSIDETSDAPLPGGLKLRQSVRPTGQYELPRNRARTTIEHGFPGDCWAQETLHRLWSFIESEPHFGEFEFTVTGFLDGRVLFITSLGPQVRAPGGEQKWTPIRYFLHAFTDDEWQMGRLVDRINTLGTLRLAATMEIEALKEVGQAMEELAGHIEKAFAHVQKAITRAGEKPLKTMKARATPAGASAQEIEDKACGEVEASMRAAEVRMRRVSQVYQTINDKVSGDVSHRLERSLYYIERFKREVAGLRERRIEGYQTYSEFVTRRMNSIFGYISFLRKRLKSVDALNSNLARHYSSLKITDVTLRIDSLVHLLTDQSSVMTEQGNKLAEQEREIGKIQEFGEFALIGALIPYYVGSVLYYIASPSGLVKEVGWFAIAMGCSALALYRIGRKRRKAEQASVGKTMAEQDAIAESTSHLWWVKRLFISYMIITSLVFAAAIAFRYYSGGDKAPRPAQAPAETHG